MNSIFLSLKSGSLLFAKNYFRISFSFEIGVLFLNLFLSLYSELIISWVLKESREFSIVLFEVGSFANKSDRKF